MRWKIGEGGFIGDIDLRAPYDDELARASGQWPVRAVAYLQVHPQRRGRGWGGLLLDAVTGWADRTGTELVLYVEPYGAEPVSEKFLVRLYRAHGFKPLRRRAGESLYMRRPPCVRS